MAENAPAAAHNTWYNENQGRSIGKNGHGVVKISGIAGSQCSYTLGTTSSFTIGASSAVTVGAALSATIGAQVSFTSAVAFTFVASRTMTITRGTAMTMVYADSYAYQKGAKYAVEAHSSSHFDPIRWDFTGEVKTESDKVKKTSSQKETKTVTETYTVNTQNYVLNVDATETKSVIGSSNESVQGIKTITSQQELNLAAVSGVSIGTAAAFMQISTKGLLQTGEANLGNPPASSLAGLLTAAAAQIQNASIALIKANAAADATKQAAYSVYTTAQTATNSAVLPIEDWVKTL